MDARPRELLEYVRNGVNLFRTWVDGLDDASSRRTILRRVARVARGNFGDHRNVGGAVWELRIHFGPGYRVYYAEEGPVVVLLLSGGDKSSQAEDIRRAKQYWTEYKSAR